MSVSSAGDSIVISHQVRKACVVWETFSLTRGSKTGIERLIEASILHTCKFGNNVLADCARVYSQAADNYF